MMKKGFLIAALSLCALGMAQKTELKTADKALKGGDAQAAKTALDGLAGSIDSADEKYQAQYYFLKGKAYADLAKKGDASAFQVAADALTKVKDMPAAKKYAAEAKQRMQALTADLVNSAVEDNGNQKFKAAAEKLYMSYKLSPVDTNYLYFAAGSAVNAQEYEMALKYYNELQEIGYDGGAMVYKATNIASGQEEEMDKSQRDLMVKSGTYKDPVDEKTPSKTAEIVKNTALIYTQLGEDEKAIDAYKAARVNEPNDVNLILNQANLYYKLGDKEKFKTLMAEATEVAPDNADLHYNIGVINMEQGNLAEARASYKSALAIDPGYTNAQLNLSTTYVNEGNGLIDEMNSLGNSKKDISRYDELKTKKDDLFKEGALVLEDALKGNPENQSILEQLKNIYGAMGDNENFMRVKKLIGE